MQQSITGPASGYFDFPVSVSSFTLTKVKPALRGYVRPVLMVPVVLEREWRKQRPRQFLLPLGTCRVGRTRSRDLWDEDIHRLDCWLQHALFVGSNGYDGFVSSSRGPAQARLLGGSAGPSGSVRRSGASHLCLPANPGDHRRTEGRRFYFCPVNNVYPWEPEAQRHTADLVRLNIAVRSI